MDQETKTSLSPYPRRTGNLNRTRSNPHHAEEKEQRCLYQLRDRRPSTKSRSSPFCQQAKWYPSSECLKRNNQTRDHRTCSKYIKDRQLVNKEANTSSSGREAQNCSRSASPVQLDRGRKRSQYYKRPSIHNYKDKEKSHHQFRWSSECESGSPLCCRKERDGCSGDKSLTHQKRTASCGCDRALACCPKDKDRCSGDSHSDGLASCQQKQKRKVHVQRSEGSISFKGEGYNTSKLYRKMVQVRNKESEISWIMISELKNENAHLKAELDDRNKASENLCLMYLRMKEKKDQALKELHTLQEHHKQIELRNSCLVEENFGLRKQLQKLKGASEPTDHVQGEEGETRAGPSTPSTSRGPSKKYSKMKHRNKSSPPENDSKMASGDACPTASSSLPTVSTSLEDARPSEPTRVLSVPDTRPAL